MMTNLVPRLTFVTWIVLWLIQVVMLLSLLWQFDPRIYSALDSVWGKLGIAVFFGLFALLMNRMANAIVKEAPIMDVGGPFADIDDQDLFRLAFPFLFAQVWLLMNVTAYVAWAAALGFGFLDFEVLFQSPWGRFAFVATSAIPLAGVFMEQPGESGRLRALRISEVSERHGKLVGFLYVEMPSLHLMSLLLLCIVLLGVHGVRTHG